MDLEKSAAPAPGWYVDPEHPDSERYWDGSAWTDQRRSAQVSSGSSAPSNGFAVTALVCGIVGIVLGVLPFTFFVAWILGIIAIVFGVLARKRFDAEPAIGRKGMATAGLILGILTIVACAIWVILFIAVIDGSSVLLDDFQYCLDHPNASRCN
jgi:lysylphosphatidylglycerol synthetase-like protein (DUF2156 family)